MSEFLFSYFIITLLIQAAIFCDNVKDNTEICESTFHAIYNKTEINQLGCFIFMLLYWIICPLFAISYFIWWIFHVGR